MIEAGPPRARPDPTRRRPPFPSPLPLTAEPLPITAVLGTLTDALRASNAAILRAPTGSGKTTRVPPALLDAGIAGRRSVVVLEPRRLAARAAAARIASERGTPLGSEVGYQVRFERRCTERTRILVLTEGLFLRRVQEDPFLEDVGAVVFDEFHERNLDGDLAIAFCRKIQSEARPDLRILAMSATLDTVPLRRFLGECPVVEADERSHDVSILYRPRRTEVPLPDAVVAAAGEALERTAGSVLVFLPGVGEIRQCHDALREFARGRSVDVLELYGDLTPEEQDAALRSGPRRRIVLATNVAESSVTLEGITAVVDSGLERLLVYDDAVGLDRLELARISKASATQRAGRAGRQAPGVCLRLWSEADERARPEAAAPEVARADVVGAVLQLRAFGESHPAAFPWLEAPAPHRVAQADRLLERLGALDGVTLTPVGRRMAEIPAHPRIARFLLEGHAQGSPAAAALAAALLSERSPFRAPAAAAHVSPSDLADRVHAMQQFEASGWTSFDVGELQRGAARRVLRVRDQLLRLLGDGVKDDPSVDTDVSIRRAAFAAYADRLARRRGEGSRRAILAGGRGARLSPASAVAEPEFFVAIDVDAGAEESIVRVASAVDRTWLAAELIETSEELIFDRERGRVVATRKTSYDGIPLTEVRVAPSNSEAVAAVLVKEVLADPAKALGLNEPETRQWLSRLRFLREWVPELGLEDVRAEDLAPRLCRGRSSLEEVRGTALLDAVRESLTHAQRAALERDAPERLAVPSGSSVRLQYDGVKPPVLAVRIQEVFGLAATPRVARGRVPVLLHLLAPNHRVQQITNDLESFWTATYPRIRRELRARYPRHAWPEDPKSAPAERRPRPRKA